MKVTMTPFRSFSVSHLVSMMACCLLLGSTVGCRPALPEPKPPKLPRVAVLKPIIRPEVQTSRYFTGKLRPSKIVDVSARVKGFLEKKHFEEGKKVKKGDLLFEIEPDMFQAKVEQAEALLQSGQSNLSKAVDDYNRGVTANKRSKDSITAEQMTERKTAVLVAKAEVAEAKAFLKESKINLSYTKIYSKASGIIDERVIDIGQLVGADGDTLLTRVQQTDPIYANFDISGPLVNDIMKFQAERKKNPDATPPDLTLSMGLRRTEEGFPHVGKIDFLASSVDSKTGKASVRAVFPNEKGALYSGSDVDIRVPKKKLTNVLMINERAVGSGIQGKYVLVVAEGKDKEGKVIPNMVYEKYIKLGELVDGMYVVEEDPKAEERNRLSPDDQYIIYGLERAQVGMPVEVEMAEQQSSSPPHAPKPEKSKPEKTKPSQ